MIITATHIAYLHTCYRKLWLFANGINMEHTSDIVTEGKMIGESTYTDRAQKLTEIEIDGIKIDFYDAKKKVVHEVKKSASVEKAHIAQVQYYLYKLQQKGIEGATGTIEYPKFKQSESVPALSGEDIKMIGAWENEVKGIVGSEMCPAVIRAKICKQCSYYDFCYSTESE